MNQSGRWIGYWIQPGYGQQPMHDLVLQFAGGSISGQGRDVVGPFTITGAYAAGGAVKLLKQYPKHQVLYQGQYDGEGTIFGTWSIPPYWAGTFALRSVRDEADPDLPITVIE